MGITKQNFSSPTEISPFYSGIYLFGKQLTGFIVILPPPGISLHHANAPL
jgi:hypothetical protein